MRAACRIFALPFLVGKSALPMQPAQFQLLSNRQFPWLRSVPHSGVKNKKRKDKRPELGS
jgi:hypothetical protein